MVWSSIRDPRPGDFPPPLSPGISQIKNIHPLDIIFFSVWFTSSESLWFSSYVSGKNLMFSHKYLNPSWKSTIIWSRKICLFFEFDCSNLTKLLFSASHFLPFFSFYYFLLDKSWCGEKRNVQWQVSKVEDNERQYSQEYFFFFFQRSHLIRLIV